MPQDRTVVATISVGGSGDSYSIADIFSFFHFGFFCPVTVFDLRSKLHRESEITSISLVGHDKEGSVIQLDLLLNFMIFYF